MPRYVPVLIALFLAVAPAAALPQPAQPVLQIGSKTEPFGARIAPLQPVPHIGPLLEPHG